MGEIQLESLLGGAKLLFSPVKLVLLIVWIYLGIYLLHWTQSSGLVPRKLRPVLNLATLIFGPLVPLAFIITDIIKRYLDSGSRLLDFLKDFITEQLSNLKNPAFTGLRGQSSIILIDSHGVNFAEVYGKGKDKGIQHIMKLTQHIVEDSITQNASDILIDPKDTSSYSIRFRIDGVLRTIDELDSATCTAVINSIKAISGMDISEKRRPQDGAFMAKMPENDLSFRVASQGVLNGEKLSIRVLNQKAGLFSLMGIGLAAAQYNVLFEALNRQSGMILVCGPTGSGKTTTVYSLLNCIDFFTRNVITIEDPIEYVLQHASQIEVNTKAGITFGNTLRSVLRQNPDVIFVGEIRDEETAAIALQASQTGHLVLATLHSSSNAAALVRLLDLGITPLLMASGLNVLVSQRLLRKLCDFCKSPADLTIAQKQHFTQRGIDPKTIFKANGCPKCHNTGYNGRIGVFDVFTMDEKTKTSIIKNELSANDLKAHGDEKGKSTLTLAGMEKVIKGLTSLEEVKRVVSNGN